MEYSIVILWHCACVYNKPLTTISLFRADNGFFLNLLQRNYRFFYMFVFSTTLLCLYVFGFCWVYIIKIRDAEHLSIWKAMLKTPASIVLIVYCFICVWFVGGLSVFHFYLMSTNQVGTIELYNLAGFKHCGSYYLVITFPSLCRQPMRTSGIVMIGGPTLTTQES
jgi:hypothetical protein